MDRLAELCDELAHELLSDKVLNHVQLIETVNVKHAFKGCRVLEISIVLIGIQVVAEGVEIPNENNMKALIQCPRNEGATVFSRVLKVCQLWTKIFSHDSFEGIPVSALQIILIVQMILLEGILLVEKFIYRVNRHSDRRLISDNSIFVVKHLSLGIESKPIVRFGHCSHI